MRFRILEDLTISSAYYRVERIKRSMNETATSRRCPFSYFFITLFSVPLYLSFSLPLSPSYSFSFFAFTANIQTPGRGWRWLGGGNGAARVRRVGVLVSLTLFSPDRSFIPSVHSLITAALCRFPTIPALSLLRPFHPSWCSGGSGLGMNCVMRAYEYITNGDQEKRFFSWKILRLRCNAAHKRRHNEGTKRGE